MNLYELATRSLNMREVRLQYLPASSIKRMRFCVGLRVEYAPEIPMSKEKGPFRALAVGA